MKTALSKHTDSVHDGANDIINGYGYQFWKNPVSNSFRADGLFGQRCFMFPEYDALVVLNCGEAEDYKVMEVFWKYFPVCFKTDLQENETAVQELNEKLSSLAMPKLEVKPRNSALEGALEGKTLSFRSTEFASVITITTTQMLYNKPGKINEMKFNFRDNSLLFTWKEKDYVNTIEAGLDGELREEKFTLPT